MMFVGVMDACFRALERLARAVLGDCFELSARARIGLVIIAVATITIIGISLALAGDGPPPSGGFEMDFIIIESAALKLLFAAVAVLLVWLAVRRLRASTGREVRRALDLIETDPIATAIYMGLTFFGICYVIARAIG